MYRVTSLLWVLLGIFLFKVGILWWIHEDPLFLYPQIDGKEYYRWALAISNGQWLQPRPFYQSPFYPYFLACLFFFFPATLLTVAFCQVVFSVATAWLLFLLTQNVFGKKSAWLTLGLYGLSGMIYFYEIQPLKTTLALFVTVLLLFLLQTLSPSNFFKIFFTGGVFGVLILIRGNTYVMLPFVGWYLWREIKLTRVGFGLCLLGCFSPLSFSLLHNYVVSHEWILNTYQGGTNFYIGNHSGATGTYKPLLSGRQVPEFEEADAISLAEKMAGKKLSYRDISNFWLQQSFVFFKQSPCEAILLQFKKLAFYFWPGEFSDGLQYSFWRTRYPFFKIFAVGYGTLWLLALYGLYGRFSPDISTRSLRLFWMFLGASLVSVVPFFIFNRYRLPVIIGLYPLAGYALRYGSKKWLAFLLMAGVSLDGWPSNLSNSYLILGTIEFQQERWAEAESSLRRAVETGNQPEAWGQLGELYLQQKDWAQAQGCFEMAIARNPQWERPYFQLGYLYLNRSIWEQRPVLEEKAQNFFQKSLQFSVQKDQTCAKIAHLYWEYSQKIMNPTYQEIALSFMSMAHQLNPTHLQWKLELQKLKTQKNKEKFE